MSEISISNLTFAYDGSYDNIFENISLSIDTDWRLGLVGRNGRGKTTFLQLLMGSYEYRGKISAAVDFQYFPFEVDNKELNSIEAVNAIAADYREWQLLRELSLLHVCEDVLYRPFATLSHGEQTKLLLAALFLHENSFLLIDEPTNHLDIEGRRILSDYLRSKKGFILVSHDRTFLDGCTDHIMSINNTDIEVQRGNFSGWFYNKQLRDDFEEAQNERLKKEAKKLESAAKRTEAWSSDVEKSKYNTRNSGSKQDKGYIGHKSAKMMKRAKSIDARRQDALDEAQNLLKNTDKADPLKIIPLTFHSELLAEVDNLAINYDGHTAVSGVSFSLNRGDRIALSGKNGSGKSSLLKLICGEAVDYSGRLFVAKGLKISYVPQDASFLSGNLSEFAEMHGVEEAVFKSTLRKLGFFRLQFEKDIADFSGGQKKKVLLAKSLCEQAHLYVWDEPLNFIDILSCMQIEALVLKYSPTLLFVEHDSAFAEAVSTKVVRL